MHINVCMHTLRFRRHCFIYISSWLQYNALHVLRKYWEKSVRSCMEMQVQHEAASITTIVAISNKYFLWATEIFSQWPYKSISCIIKIGWALITPKSSSSSPFGWNLAMTKRTVFSYVILKMAVTPFAKEKKLGSIFYVPTQKQNYEKRNVFYSANHHLAFQHFWWLSVLSLSSAVRSGPKNGRSDPLSAIKKGQSGQERDPNLQQAGKGVGHKIGSQASSSSSYSYFTHRVSQLGQWNFMHAALDWTIRAWICIQKRALSWNPVNVLRIQLDILPLSRSF